jgi:hypothetical protein
MGIVELISTKKAATQAGISVTHFQRLAKEPPKIYPLPIDGSASVAWTPEQVIQVKERRKR